LKPPSAVLKTSLSIRKSGRVFLDPYIEITFEEYAVGIGHDLHINFCNNAVVHSERPQQRDTLKYKRVVNALWVWAGKHHWCSE
jgi:hypothetical protein